METIESRAPVTPWFVRFTTVAQNHADSQSREAGEPAFGLCAPARERM